MTMEVRILDAESLKDAGAEWERLLLCGKMPSPFCSLDLILPWIEHYSGEYEPVVLCVFEGGAARAFLPLAARRGGLFGGRVLTFCASNELYSDHLDIISSPEHAGRCLDAVWGFLQGEGLAWEALDLSLVSSGSSIMEHARDFADNALEVRERSVAPYIDLSAGFDAYMSGFNGKHRYTLKKKARRLSGEGFSYEACRPETVEAGVGALFELHGKRAASKGIKSSFSGERLLSLHRAAARSLSGKGRLWLRFLERDDKKIAAFYGFELGGRLFYYQFGIDPEWEPFSPGTVLMFKVIEEAFAKGLKEFDFLRGAESYKSGWTGDRRALYSIRSYRKSMSGGLSRTVGMSKDFLKRNVRRLLS